MATITSTADGDWSNGATWVGGVAPTAADDAVIAKNHVVTLDALTCVAKSITLNVGTTGSDVGGRLVASTSVSTKLVVENSITSSGSTGASGTYSSHVEFDVSANPAINCTVVLNNARVTGAGHGLLLEGSFVLAGAEKKYHTVLSAAVSAGASVATVDDATGWAPGDAVIFATTSPYVHGGPVKTDILELDATYTPGSTSLVFSATPDTAKYPGAVATFVYDHASNCPAGNLNRNLEIRPHTPGDIAWVSCNGGTSKMPGFSKWKNIFFNSLRANGSYPRYLTVSVGTYTSKLEEISGCVFFNSATGGLSILSGNSQIERADNLYIGQGSSRSTYIYNDGTFGDLRSETDSVFFSGGIAFGAHGNNVNLVRAKISGYSDFSASRGTITIETVDVNLIDVQVWSCRAAIKLNGSAAMSGGGFGGAVFAGCENEYDVSINYGTISLKDVAVVPAELTLDGTDSLRPKAKITIENKNLDPAVQEIYSIHGPTVPLVQRDAANRNRSTSSVLLTCSTADVAEHSFNILAKAGETITLIAYVMKSGSPAYGSSTLPSVTVSGLGITPVVATMDAGTAADTWEKLTLTATNSGASDGLLTVTFKAQSATAGAKAWFSGVPVAPFVSRCRHYGFLFDETIPTRIANITVSAAEATAAAYTGMTVTWGASSSSTTITADNTFQKLYDYTQAQGCLNVGSAMPLNGAGVAGNPALFAAGNVTLSSAVLNGSGSLTMGAFTLSGSMTSGGAYTFTGGTYSRLTTLDAFSGGQLNIGDAGTYVFSMSEGRVDLTPSAPGTYNFGGGTFSGSINVRNTAAHAVTVQVPSGASFNSTGNTGGAITFVAPVVTADISITGMPTAAGAERRLQIFNDTARSAAAWQAATAYSLGAVRLRTTGVGSENTAGLYLRCTTAGTSGGSEPTWNTTPGGTTNDGTAVWTTYSVLYYDADPASATLTDTYVDGAEFLAGETVTIRFAEMDGPDSFKSYSTSVVATADGFSALVAAESNEVFAENALDGTDYESTFSPNFALNYIVLDTNTDFSGKAAFAYFCYTLTTSNGMYQFWGGVTALDSGNYRINNDVLNLYFDETAGFVKQTDNVRIFRKDGARPVLDPTTGDHGIEMNWRVPVNVVSTGGSAMTAEEHAKLMALPSADTIWNGITLP